MNTFLNRLFSIVTISLLFSPAKAAEIRENLEGSPWTVISSREGGPSEKLPSLATQFPTMAPFLRIAEKTKGVFKEGTDNLRARAEEYLEARISDHRPPRGRPAVTFPKELIDYDTIPYTCWHPLYGTSARYYEPDVIDESESIKPVDASFASSSISSSSLFSSINSGSPMEISPTHSRGSKVESISVKDSASLKVKVSINDPKAETAVLPVEYFTSVSVQESTLRFNNLGVSYMSGKNGKPTQEEALEALRNFTLAYQGGLAEAEYNIGRLYYYEYVYPGNSKIGVAHFLEAARAGVMPAQYKMGTILLEDKIVPQDIPQAIAFLEIAHRQGHPSAEKALSEAIAKGHILSAAAS